MEIHERAIKAAKTFLERQGYQVVEEVGAFGFDLIATYGRGRGMVTAFINVTEEYDEMPESCKAPRRVIERGMAKYAKEYSADEPSFRYDEICFNIISDSSAVLKHHINAMMEYGMAERAESFIKEVRSLSEEQKDAVRLFAAFCDDFAS